MRMQLSAASFGGPALIFAVLLVGCTQQSAPTEPALEIVVDGDPERPELRARLPELPEQLGGSVPQDVGEQWLRLALVRDDDTDGEPIFGTYTLRGNELRFVPNHPLEPGTSFRATLELPDGRKIVRPYDLPLPPVTERARVSAVFPSGDEVPANLLKFYVHFSAPMREGDAVQTKIQLLGGDGKPIPEVWRMQELWSEDGRRLTLWVHPGRIKRGVGPRQALGPAMLPGRSYTLVIPATLRDQRGHSLAEGYRKTFRTTAEDRACPLPQSWKLSVPKAGTTDPLVIEFGEPLDSALVPTCLVVDGTPGRVTLGEGDGSSRFVPDGPWPARAHVLRIDPDLEDLAGNRPRRRFEERPGAPPRQGKLELTFTPR